MGPTENPVLDPGNINRRRETRYPIDMRTGTTRLNARGQVVIPTWARDQLALVAGMELSVAVLPGPDRAIILRPAGRTDTEDMLEPGYVWLEQSGEDPVEAFHAARRRARIDEVSVVVVDAGVFARPDRRRNA